MILGREQMNTFRFAVMGAGGIANHFCDAVRLTAGAQVCAIASKSMERAQKFARANDIPAAYDSYEKMLAEEKPDCVYIAVTNDSHYELTKLCLAHKTPVLCEKAFVPTAKEAKEIFEISEKQGTFVMEAMWARFTPTTIKAKEWIDAGKIGKVRMIEARLGFAAVRDMSNRFFDLKLGGGAALDVLVYTYELTDYMMGREPQKVQVTTQFWETGVDSQEMVLLTYDDALAVLETSILTNMGPSMDIYGETGKIHIPGLHFAKQIQLENGSGEVVEEFTDDETENGFVYEIAETMRCVREGLVESPTVPHSLTIASAQVYDQLWAQRP